MSLALPPPSFHYSPGLWQQDIYTMPLSLGLIGLMNASYTEAAQPLWPFANESNNRQRKQTRHSKALLTTTGAALLAGTFGSAYLANESFPWMVHVRGLIQTHIITELATSFAKVTWLRRRPFYDVVAAQEKAGTGRVAKDDRFSFFSGHSSHAFAFASYTGSILVHYLPCNWCAWSSMGLLYLGAGTVAAARAIDGQHHWSDVIAGAAVGGTLGILMFQRVESVIDTYGLRPQKKVTGKMTPILTPEGQIGLALSLKY